MEKYKSVKLEQNEQPKQPFTYCTFSDTDFKRADDVVKIIISVPLYNLMAKANVQATSRESRFTYMESLPEYRSAVDTMFNYIQLAKTANPDVVLFVKFTCPDIIYKNVAGFFSAVEFHIRHLDMTIIRETMLHHYIHWMEKTPINSDYKQPETKDPHKSRLFRFAEPVYILKQSPV